MKHSPEVRLRAHRMFEAGAEYAEVERVTGVNISTLRNWRGSSLCVDCDTPLAEAAVVRCEPCARIARLYWTPERIVAAVRAFVERYGRTPTALDWNPSQAVEKGHPEIAARFYEDGCWPWQYTCTQRVGSLNAAIELAGYTPRPTGHRIGMKPWPREAILTAIREWVELYGDTPGIRDWSPAADSHPHASQVQTVFGTWNAAIRAAGFTPRAPGETREREAIAA